MVVGGVKESMGTGGLVRFLVLSTRSLSTLELDLVSGLLKDTLCVLLKSEVDALLPSNNRILSRRDGDSDTLA